MEVKDGPQTGSQIQNLQINYSDSDLDDLDSVEMPPGSNVQGAPVDTRVSALAVEKLVGGDLKIFQKVLMQVAPYVGKTINSIDNLADVFAPYYAIFARLLGPAFSRVEQYKEEVFPGLFGLCLVFFGGHFPATLAAVESFRTFATEQTLSCVHELCHQGRKARLSIERDNRLDLDNNGIPDVDELGSNERVSRRLLLVLQSTEPEKVNEAVKGIAAALTAVVASLRLKLAHTSTLGCNLGSSLSTAAVNSLAPTLESSVDDVYKPWVKHGVAYSCQFIGMSLAWWMQRLLTAVYGGFKGSKICVDSLLQYAHRKGYINDVESVQSDGRVLYGTLVLAGLGISLQVRRGVERMPFPFNLILMPARISEWLLEFFISHPGVMQRIKA